MVARPTTAGSRPSTSRTARPSWTTQHGTSVRTAPAVDGDQVVVADRGGEVTAYAVADGTVRWSHSLEGGTLAGPAVADGRVDRSGTTRASSTRSPRGPVSWTGRSGPSSTPPRGSPPATGRSSPSATGSGSRPTTSTTVTSGGASTSTRPPRPRSWVTTRSPSTTRHSVVVRDLATAAERGGLGPAAPGAGGHRVRRLPRRSRRRRPRLQRQRHRRGTQLDPLRLPAVRGRRPQRCLLRHRGPRAARGPPTGAPCCTATCSSRPASTRPSTAASPAPRPARSSRATGCCPGSPRAGDLVISQKGTEVLRASRSTVATRCGRYESTDAGLGAVPAANEDTVFVPQYGVGLAAVSLADGTGALVHARWTSPSAAPRPLPLPGGDVVYGGGAVSRFDGATGKMRWSILDGVLFGSAAYADGSSSATSTAPCRASGLTALDAETGETVWLHENPNTQIGIGPVVGEGVVVHMDSPGADHGLRGRHRRGAVAPSSCPPRPPVSRWSWTGGSTSRRPAARRTSSSVSTASPPTTCAPASSWVPTSRPARPYWITPSVGGSDGAVLVPGLRRPRRGR